MRSSEEWFRELGWSAFPFQNQCKSLIVSGESGLLNAPTGSGKTYALLLGILEMYAQARSLGLERDSLFAIWITPIRALAEEIRLATERAIAGMQLDARVAVRTGDTDAAAKAKMDKQLPAILITTPESMHLFLGRKEYPKKLQHLSYFICDEWHELMGSKRGVLIELALSRLRSLRPHLSVWGISASIGNMQEAMEVLCRNGTLVKANIPKPIQVIPILPTEVEKMPWYGHLGIKLMDQVLPVIRSSKSCLLFTNTRAQAEIWYQRLLDAEPDLAGRMAIHHSSIAKEIRQWVEDQLHGGNLQLVVCTGSLDLGVDFRPVETIIQVGGPKGIARFVQRAGRSGHTPGAVSNIYFLPVHSLELIESAALREAIQQGYMEPRVPYVRCFDVLAQYLMTLAISEGFQAQQVFDEIKQTHCYESMTEVEFNSVLMYLLHGGESLQAYQEFQKLDKQGDTYLVSSRRTAMRHRLSIGVIVGDGMLKVGYMRGGYLGMIEEWFISRLNPGDVFWFAGRYLEYVQIKEQRLIVKNTSRKSGIVPAWMGGRMPLSAELGGLLRKKLYEGFHNESEDPELVFIQPIFQLQKERSHIPAPDELLIEVFETKEGQHICVYPFEGRFIHEAMASLLTTRMTFDEPMSFSISVNDYGFELLCNKKIEVDEEKLRSWLHLEGLSEDIQRAINTHDLAMVKFRDIAVIGGLVFQGYPNQGVREKHLRSSSQVLFKALNTYDPGNIFLRQAYDEAMVYQIEEHRLRSSLTRIANHKLIITYPEKPSPLAFPIMVDRLRQKMTTESVEDRVKQLQISFS